MTPEQELAIRQHKAWLLLFIQDMRPGNYIDMEARIERQLAELCAEFEKLNHPPTSPDRAP